MVHNGRRQARPRQPVTACYNFRMKQTKGIGALIIILIIALSAVGVVISLWFPRTWVNDPPKCCDIPNGGTYVGFPFEIKGTSCCNIAGTSTEEHNYTGAAYNFIIYFVVLVIITLIFEKIPTKSKPSKAVEIDITDFKD